jgi:hypothetical protein
MKKIPLLLFMLLLCAGVYAQNLSKSGVLKMNVRSTGPIVQNGQVKGYYLFYMIEKQDRKNYNYQLNVYDENLREINSVSIVRPRTFVLVEGAFNGEVFGFLFYDSKAKAVELMAYDKTLKQTGSVKKVVNNKFLVATYKNIAIGNEPSQAFFVPVSNKGFLYYGLKPGSKMHFEMLFVDNSMKTVWSQTATEGAKHAVEMASEAFQSEKYVGSLITIKKGLASRDTDSYLAVHETLTGKVVFRVPMYTDKYSVSFSDVFFDEKKQSFTVFGEYFNADDKELKARSLGFIAWTFDMTGKSIALKTNSWENEISKAAPVDERGKFDGNNTSILFHNIIRTDDGKIFVVGEQYKKAASAGGIISNVAMTALGGSPTASNVQLNIYNMTIFEFTSDYSLKKVHVFEKDKNVLQLPGGYGTLSPRLLSYYAKAVGGFDYAFTQESKDKSTFYVSYVNYDREKGEKAKNVLGTIVYTPEKVFTVDKLPMARKSTLYFVHKAKEGYVMITEYFKKEKRLESRLEKVNY